MPKLRTAHLAPPAVVKAGVHLVFGSSKACAEALGIGNGNLINFLNGRPTLGTEHRGAVYEGVGLTALGYLDARRVHDFVVTEEVSGLATVLSYAGASEKNKFKLTAVQNPGRLVPGRVYVPQGPIFAVVSNGSSDPNDPAPRYRFRVYYRPRAGAPRFGPGVLPCLEWADPQVVHPATETYFAWLKGKRVSISEFDAVILASAGAWDDVYALLGGELGLTAGQALDYINYLRGKGAAADALALVRERAERARALRRGRERT